ncbi:MAG: hypothetical protein H0X51_04130 [Parachlamydiaceae bacterium]|nr:hypothetical protein [Parachlamydiaceae bacterium]
MTSSVRPITAGAGFLGAGAAGAGRVETKEIQSNRSSEKALETWQVTLERVKFILDRTRYGDLFPKQTHEKSPAKKPLAGVAAPTKENLEFGKRWIHFFAQYQMNNGKLYYLEQNEHAFRTKPLKRLDIPFETLIKVVHLTERFLSGSDKSQDLKKGTILCIPPAEEHNFIVHQVGEQLYIDCFDAKEPPFRKGRDGNVRKVRQIYPKDNGKYGIFKLSARTYETGGKEMKGKELKERQEETCTDMLLEVENFDRINRGEQHVGIAPSPSRHINFVDLDGVHRVGYKAAIEYSRSLDTDSNDRACQSERRTLQNIRESLQLSAKESVAASAQTKAQKKAEASDSDLDSDLDSDVEDIEPTTETVAEVFGEIGAGARLSFKEHLLGFRQLLAGLDYLDGRGLVHTDCKPGNVLILTDATGKMVRFDNADFSAIISMDNPFPETYTYAPPYFPREFEKELDESSPTAFYKNEERQKEILRQIMPNAWATMFFEICTGALPSRFRKKTDKPVTEIPCFTRKGATTFDTDSLAARLVPKFAEFLNEDDAQTIAPFVAKFLLSMLDLNPKNQPSLKIALDVFDKLLVTIGVTPGDTAESHEAPEGKAAESKDESKAS